MQNSPNGCQTGLDANSYCNTGTGVKPYYACVGTICVSGASAKDFMQQLCSTGSTGAPLSTYNACSSGGTVAYGGCIATGTNPCGTTTCMMSINKLS